MVTVSSPSRRYSIADLDTFPDDGRLRELVDGQLVEWDGTTPRHGFLETVLVRELSLFARDHRFGKVSSGDALVRILGSEYDARGADIAFFRRTNMPRDLDAPATLTIPDLVVEILSPSDRASRVLEKVNDWLRTGVHLLWYINPETGATTVYHAGHVSHVAANEPLDGADVLPGLVLRMSDLLGEIHEDDQTT